MNFTTKFLKQIGTEKKFDNFKNTLFFTSWKYVFANNIGILPFKKIDTEYSSASDGVFHATFDGVWIKLLNFKVSKIVHALEIPWPRFTLVTYLMLLNVVTARRFKSSMGWSCSFFSNSYGFRSPKWIIIGFLIYNTSIVC